MKNLKPKRQGWIWLTVLLLVFILISIFVSSQKPKQYPNYVSNSPSPTGLKALYTYLQKEVRVNSWTAEPLKLPKQGEEKLLVMVEPSFIPETEEMEAYQDFMKAGNTILLFQTNPKGMFDLDTVPKQPSPNHEVKWYGENQRTFKTEINSPFRIVTNKDDAVRIEDAGGGAIALKRSVGKGQLIVAITPEWLINDNLLKKDNLALVLNLFNEAKTGTVLFDEYIHGSQNGSSIMTVYPMWFLLLLLQGILLMMLWLWFKGKRFGPLLVPREESVRFSDEGIRAITAWYLRGRRYHDSLLIQADYLKLLLQERWRIPYRIEWKDLSSFLVRQHIGMQENEIRPFLIGLTNILEKEKVSKQEYLLWSRSLEQLRKEVEEG
ncbi:DUF4350 domain-containing protein [Neobacillus vireti]|uniref:DUF4350 domain-containing protein n=1 Tax=Neobacillus vireti LMG 21834 TaxID=1131730 RepID=A0AB94IP81_9BACI|nr:DUF4350 domain-containing protein [Neobacillus vireti]ETI68870.1 hypothetical protein BAVI_08921 [Neobacillus vireti LMG 21834]KLT15814.1 hypothetical protein AA980_21625 [Neobacillus vireti]